MGKKKRTKEICYLCGKSIEKGRLARDHVPPKAFYPKDVRAGLNLQVVPSHKECNEAYRKDEEYFQHAFYVEVLRQQPAITPHLKNDFLRRSRKPQTPAMIRKILKGASAITPGGIHLPPSTLQLKIDRARIEKVALKIARGLFYIDEKRFLPLKNAKDIRFCLNGDNVPDLYRLYWPYVERRWVCPAVFSYKYFKFEDLQLYSLFFWEAIMSCAAFGNP